MIVPIYSCETLGNVVKIFLVVHVRTNTVDITCSTMIHVHVITRHARSHFKIFIKTHLQQFSVRNSCKIKSYNLNKSFCHLQ